MGKYTRVNTIQSFKMETKLDFPDVKSFREWDNQSSLSIGISGLTVFCEQHEVSVRLPSLLMTDVSYSNGMLCGKLDGQSSESILHTLYGCRDIKHFMDENLRKKSRTTNQS